MAKKLWTDSLSLSQLAGSYGQKKVIKILR